MPVTSTLVGGAGHKIRFDEPWHLAATAAWLRQHLSVISNATLDIEDMSGSPSMTDTVRTRVDAVYIQVRADILAGRLHPGDKLPLAELTKRYDAKMGTVREALLKLASEEDLVVAGPGRVPGAPDLHRRSGGAHRGPSGDGGRGLPALDQAGDLEWEIARVIASHHRLTRVEQMDPDDPARINDDWARAHAEFHETLLSGCTNARLRNVALSLARSSSCTAAGRSPQHTRAGTSLPSTAHCATLPWPARSTAAYSSCAHVDNHAGPARRRAGCQPPRERVSQS